MKEEMREILFRGKRKANGEWLYGNYLKTSYGSHFIMERSKELNAYKDLTAYEVIPETVGQYTGKNDKDGRRIFDGDILKAGCSMLVVWDEKFASWCVIRKGWAYKHFFGEGLSEEDCEVIGNIHDNPELVEV